MIVATQGLVLHTTSYSESSVIAKIFTRQLGLRSYILKGVRRGTSRTKQNLLQPLSYVDLSVYDSPKTSLNYVKEIHPARQFAGITADAARVTLIFFMNELLYKTLTEGDPQPEIFDMVVAELDAIDQGAVRNATQPLLFMLRLSSLLGIEPMNNYGLHETRFHLGDGRFVQPPSPRDLAADATALLDDESSLQLHYLLAAYHESGEQPRVNAPRVLRILIDYYGYHLPECRNLRSVEVLHALLA